VIAITGNQSAPRVHPLAMYVEQMQCESEICNRGFAVQYEFGGPRVPSSSDLVTLRDVSCPSCRHSNPLIIWVGAHHLAVKAIPGPDPAHVRARSPIGRQLMAAVAEFGRRIRPFFP